MQDLDILIIKVFSGENLIAEAPELRLIRIIPDGTMGATYKKKVYPLYLGQNVLVQFYIQHLYHM